MEAVRLSFLLALLGGFLQLGDSLPRDCSGTCTIQFKCDPYYKDLTWTIVDKVCRVFKNPCIFASNNCHRENQCLKVLTATSQEKCMKYCPACCPPCGGPPVCALFTYTDVDGVRKDREVDFSSLCHADQYACQNADAYIGEPRIGPCK
ncbi:salivary glue protein Sgs-5-like [Drosophila kikkawai]|uniref:Salivary glue protein Sgs-5-like n=1 Tax=Drosophila kikkawai TaxID=30033 RepID=A0ABM4GI19_DROKI